METVREAECYDAGGATSPSTLQWMIKQGKIARAGEEENDANQNRERGRKRKMSPEKSENCGYRTNFTDDG